MFRKVMAMILSMVMLLGLCACKKSTPQDSVNEQEPSLAPTLDQTQKPTEDPTVDDPDENEPEDPEPAIQLDIQQGTIFNEGMALVTLRDSDGVYAINEKGNVLFQLEDVSLATSFYNGLAFVSYAGDNFNFCYALCDKNGNRYNADQFGGTGFVDLQTEDSLEELLSDGLILVHNEDQNTLGVMDAEFNWLVPMSNEFLTQFEAFKQKNQWYIDGYMLEVESRDSGEYLNLRTGEMGKGINSVDIERISDLYYANEYGQVMDARTQKVVFQIDGTKKIICNGITSYRFHEGRLLLMDLEITPGTTEYRMRYYVLDDQGNMLVEPTYKESKYAGMVIAVDSSVSLSDDKLLLSYATTQTVVNSAGSKEAKIDTRWEIRDLNGNVCGEFEVVAPPEDERCIYYISSSEAHMHDSRIMVTYIVMSYNKNLGYTEAQTYTQYFDTNFVPLF